ncbi:uncharacterized protein VNE69_06238 [Vairimorpha necatrix]|uniref:Uncharacterized protein n=1 Tax=Vairimorpha necatrix TaxID=6039 RepID=A0AAX4JD81_9MICR
MEAKTKILKYLEIINHSSISLDYISKLNKISDVYDIETISIFYYSYRQITEDLKINNKSSVSINYVLARNFILLEKINNKFFVQILLDNEDIMELPDNLELRLVELINTSHLDAHLFKYINLHRNKLKISEKTIKHIFNNPSFFMKYLDSDVKVIRQILLKNRDQKYKQDLIKYIETQGCINNIILYNCIVSKEYKIQYINNINVNELKNNVCYNHLMAYLEKCKILQKYLISKEDLDVMLKYPEYCDIMDLMNIIKHDVYKEEILLIYLINKKNISSYELEKIINELGEDNHYIKEYCKVNKKIENKRKKIKTNDYNTGSETSKKLEASYRDLNDKMTECIGMQENKQTSTNFFCKETNFINTKNMTHITNDQKSNNIDRNTQNLDQNYKDQTIIYPNKINDFSINKVITTDMSFNDILANDSSLNLTEVNSFLDSLFNTYDFKYNYNIIIGILKKYEKPVTSKIQEYLMKILEEGFFEECYFDMIRNLYNRLLKYCTNTKTRKNNDMILIGLSKYCKYFNKEVSLGNVKNNKKK